MAGPVVGAAPPRGPPRAAAGPARPRPRAARPAPPRGPPARAAARPVNLLLVLVLGEFDEAVDLPGRGGEPARQRGDGFASGEAF